MRTHRKILIVSFASLLVPASAAGMQSETSTFTYDALGRVVEVESDRGIETVDFDFTYDDADNRTSATVTETTTSASTQSSQGPGQAAQPD